MILRLLHPSPNNSFFLFGARGTGKSTFLKDQFKMKSSWFLDLLDPEIENFYAKTPKHLERELLGMKKRPEWIVIDEIQKVPRLLDMVHRLIEQEKQKFILTGSSARKLKQGSANLLAGRAFVNHLFPISSLELDKNLNLIEYLQWGGLPQIFSYKSANDKKAFLSSYVLTYLNEEVRMEQLIRKLDPFRFFLEIAGQVSGKIINHSKIANEVGVDVKTIQSYFQILEDTLLGFYLPAFHLSVRKSQKHNPKFYLFDTGVKKALEGSLEQVPVERTSSFGELFESMIILEIYRLNSYLKRDYKLSYFQTKNNSEIDLILTKNKKHILVEIKSSDVIDLTEVASLGRVARNFPNVQACYYVSRAPQKIKEDLVLCLPWQDFLKNI